MEIYRTVFITKSQAGKHYLIARHTDEENRTLRFEYIAETPMRPGTKAHDLYKKVLEHERYKRMQFWA